jgi:hypothetical protein
MCGYCWEEGPVLEIVEAESHKQIDKIIEFEGRLKEEMISPMGIHGFPCLYSTPYLQESYEAKKGIKYCCFDDINGHSQAILCRTIEYLLKNGYDSDESQELLEMKSVQIAIEKECKDKLHANNQIKDSILRPVFHPLYDEKTYLSKESWNHFIFNKKDLQCSCQSILQFFNDWWLQGKDLKTKDPDEYFVKYGILDPLNKRHGESHALFKLLYRCFFFSLLFLEKSDKNNILRYQLIKNDPFFTPDFEAFDLWLQRKAIVEQIEKNGIDNIIAHLSDIRPQLIYYAALKLNLTKKDKDTLTLSMRKIAKTESVMAGYLDLLETNKIEQ